MRARSLLKIANVITVFFTVITLILIGEDDVRGLLPLVAAGFLVHTGVDAFIALKRRKRLARTADISEFSMHQLYKAADLEAALQEARGGARIALPVILEGAIKGEARRNAPLSGKPALAWHVEAFPRDGFTRSFEDAEGIEIEHAWEPFGIEDETGTQAIEGPGIIDGSWLTERVFSIETLRSEMPRWAALIEDKMGLKLKPRARFLVREKALCPEDPVRVYGTARKGKSDVKVSGNSVLDDPGSLLVRSLEMAASQKARRESGRERLAIAFFILSALAFAASIAIHPDVGLLGPGGIFDAERRGTVLVDEAGRELRLEIDGLSWSFEQGESASGQPLSDGNDGSFSARAESIARVYALEANPSGIAPGEPGYPVWQGSFWSMRISDQAPQPRERARGGKGRLYCRNLVDAELRLKLYSPEGLPLYEASAWTYEALEHSNKQWGSYLVFGEKPAPVTGEDIVELWNVDGSTTRWRIDEAARWEDGAWALDLTHSLLAAKGPLRASNAASRAVRLWIVNPDGSYPFGSAPWELEAGAGTEGAHGLNLQSSNRDISFTGKEIIRYGFIEARLITEGRLVDLGRYSRGSWILDLKALAEGR
jgi:hypothetical protein